jgi:MFS family permease
MRPRIAMAACYGLTGAVTALWASALPATDARLSLGPGRLGAALTALAVGGLCTMPVAGRLADRYTGSRLLRTVAPAAALALLAPAAAASYAALLPAAVLLGMLLGALNVALSVQAVALEDALRRPIISGLHGAWSLGAVGGGAAVSWSLHASLGVRVLPMVAAPILAAAFYVTAAETTPPAASPDAAVLAAVPVTAVSLPSVPSDEARRTGAIGQAATLGAGLTVMLGLVGAAAFVAEGAATDWAGVHVTRVLGADPATGSLVYTVFFATMTAVRFAGDSLRDRLGAAASLRAGGLVAGCGYGLVLLAGALPGTVAGKVGCALVGWVMVGAGMAMVWPIVLSTLGAARGSAARLSVVTTISYGGGLAGPALIGALAASLSLPLALSAPAVLALAVAFVAPRLLAVAGGDQPPDQMDTGTGTTSHGGEVAAAACVSMGERA